LNGAVEVASVDKMDLTHYYRVRESRETAAQNITRDLINALEQGVGCAEITVGDAVREQYELLAYMVGGMLFSSGYASHHTITHTKKKKCIAFHTIKMTDEQKRGALTE